MNTKVTQSVRLNERVVMQIVNQNIETILKNELSKFSFLYFEIVKLLNNSWVYIENKKVYYNDDVVGLIPDLKNFQFGACSTNRYLDKSTLSLNFADFHGELMTGDELKKCFPPGNNIIKDLNINIKAVSFKKGNAYRWCKLSDGTTLSFKSGVVYTSYHIPLYRLNGKSSSKPTPIQTIGLWLKNNLIPQGLSPEANKQYAQLKELYSQNRNYIYLDKNKKMLTFNISKIMEEIKSGKFGGKINEVKFDRESMIEEVKSKGMIKVSDKLLDSIKKKLLECDKTRVDIESYDEKILTDPNRGHWDLWEHQSEIETHNVQLSEEFMARNPAADINENGVVGIDFGTKSTIVVYQKDSDHILPMRVGTGNLSKKIEAKHYENPTVMEFANIDKFLAEYKVKAGRPETSWQDITVSHTASESMLNSSSKEYYSYLNELKQWAGDNRRQIRLRDKQNKDVLLPPFLELDDEKFNPIEIYAYYIGLYINNMRNGIYLDYFLSFPVTYEEAVREKITESFARGLKKSLPKSLLQNEDVMGKFRINSNISEPAAYAVCALQEYGFEPNESEEIFYGIFDFGGGTTDFDFGLWREANNKERRYDYVIEHFGAGGDQYLGGENLLELITFELFKSNQDKLRENGITFTIPNESKRFAGSEVLLSDSQEARLNTKQLMEKLRPLWERHEGYEKEFETGVIKANLFDKSGQPQLNFELSVNKDELEQVLKERIEKGVINFFSSLQLTFGIPSTEKVKFVNIFLAGNSSKSQLVKDIFNKHIEDITVKINGSKEAEGEYFGIFPPLGTEEACDKLEERKIDVDKNNVEKPTGKTGVAFGLLKCRKGGNIKVVDKNKGNGKNGKSSEIGFQYFIGYNKKGKFTVMENVYNNVAVVGKPDYSVWYNFIDAAEEDFELYYTKLPESINGKLKSSDVQKKRCRICTVDEEAFVYVRAVSPKVLEYVVATESGISKEEYLSDIIKLNLVENRG